MTVRNFSDLAASSPLDFTPGTSRADSTLLRFDDSLSASDLVLTPDTEAGTLRLAAGGKVITLFSGQRLTMNELKTWQFRFDDHSQVVFSNSENDFTRSLRGGSGADLLIGSQPGSAPTLVSSRDGFEPGDDSSGGGSLSAGGRFIAFASTAADISTIDANGHRSDVFLEDLFTGSLTQLSATGSAGWSAPSFAPAISADGKVVAFLGRSSNVEPDTDYAAVIVQDLSQPGAPRNVIGNPQFDDPNGSVGSVALSADGQRVVFLSNSTDLVFEDQNTLNDVFYLDWNRFASVVLVSIGQDGEAANGNSARPSVSEDGRFIAFNSDASNLVANDSHNGKSDIFVRDTVAGTTTLVSQSGTGATATLASYNAAISSDGKFVAFQSYDSFGLAGDTNGKLDIFIKNLQTQEVRIVSADTNAVARGSEFDAASAAGGGAAPRLSISGDGRYVAFYSSNPLLVPDDNNTQQEVFVKDLLTGRIARVRDVDDPLAFNGFDSSPSISVDGSQISFAHSGATTLATARWQTEVVDNPLFAVTLSGGKGNDTYQIANAADTIRESAHGGHGDTVNASISYQLGANLENLVLIGKAVGATGNALDNVLTGNASNNRLDGGAGADTLTGGRGKDMFLIASTDGADTITDFRSKADHLVLDALALGLGDGDALIDGGTLRKGPGGFDEAAELVVFTRDISGALTRAAAARAIGSADDAFAPNDHRIFVVDNGHDTAIYRFESSGADAGVSAGELDLLATLEGTKTVLGDYLFGA